MTRSSIKELGFAFGPLSLGKFDSRSMEHFAFEDPLSAPVSGRDFFFGPEPLSRKQEPSVFALSRARVHCCVVRLRITFSPGHRFYWTVARGATSQFAF